MTETDQLSLLGSIYRTVLEPDAWPRVVSDLCASIGAAAGGVTFREGMARSSVRQVWTGIGSDFDRAYTQHFYRDDPFALAAVNKPAGWILRGSVEVPHDRLRRTEFYNELFYPA